MGRLAVLCSLHTIAVRKHSKAIIVSAPNLHPCPSKDNEVLCKHWLLIIWENAFILKHRPSEARLEKCFL